MEDIRVYNVWTFFPLFLVLHSSDSSFVFPGWNLFFRITKCHKCHYELIHILWRLHYCVIHWQQYKKKCCFSYHTDISSLYSILFYLFNFNNLVNAIQKEGSVCVTISRKLPKLVANWVLLMQYKMRNNRSLIIFGIVLCIYMYFKNFYQSM